MEGGGGEGREEKWRGRGGGADENMNTYRLTRHTDYKQGRHLIKWKERRREAALDSSRMIVSATYVCICTLLWCVNSAWNNEWHVHTHPLTQTTLCQVLALLISCLLQFLITDTIFCSFLQ